MQTSPRVATGYDTYTVTLMSGLKVVIEAELIGWADSHSERHADHDGVEFQRPGQRCSACRWIEVAVYRVRRAVKPRDQDTGRFLYQTIGHSIVPGERTLVRGQFTDHGHELLEMLMVRKNGHSFLPTPSARALAQAASVEGDIEHAYVNRPV